MDHVKTPFHALVSYASELDPSDELVALGASAGASEGLGADADSLGASELDEEELDAATASGATATATMRITISARARAIVVGAISGAFCCSFLVWLLLWWWWLMPGDSGSFIREMVVIFGSGMFRDALRWRVTGYGTWRRLPNWGLLIFRHRPVKMTIVELCSLLSLWFLGEHCPLFLFF